jgi:hypothetical protein
MSGTNGGTGRPYNFRCSRCRKSNRPWPQGAFSRVALTGRGGGRNATDGLKRQYICSDCNHTGWSRHIDLQRKTEAA